MVLLARWLTPESFGQFQLVLSMVWIFPILVDWGISHSLPRYLAEFRSQDAAMVRPALLAGLRLKLVAMITGTLVLIMLGKPLSTWFNLDPVSHVLPLGLLLLLGFSLNDFFLKLSEGFQRFEAVPVEKMIILTVFFPARTMGLAPYNRLVQAPPSESESLVAALGEAFQVEALGPLPAFQPVKTHEIGLYTAGAWYRLTPRPSAYDTADAVQVIDANIVQRKLFAAVFGIPDYSRQA